MVAEFGATFANHEVVISVLLVHVWTFGDVLCEAFPDYGGGAEGAGGEVDGLLVDAGEVEVGLSIVVPEDAGVDVEEGEDEGVAPGIGVVGVGGCEEEAGDGPGG